MATLRVEQQAMRPLCVDLDGTLIRSDVLVESFLELLKRNPLYLFLLPLWLLKGKAHFKQQIAKRVELDVRLLPYHREFLAHLRQQRERGRRMILATASNRKFADGIAAHLGIFDAVFASDGETNLSGRRKLERFRSEFGEGGFDYAGNAKADLTIWAAAGDAILVNPLPGVRKAAEAAAHVAAVFDDRSEQLRNYLKAMRLHQWLKNLLLFVPLLLAHKVGEPELLLQAALGFLSFGLCASSVYLLNDLIDLPSDRQHPSKRYRPFAAGSISIINGALLVPALLIAAFAVALLLPVEFSMVLLLYYTVTLSYSLRLKRSALIDVLVLAGLYTLRILAGAAAVSLAPSFWLLALSMFLFLSIALVKRYTELLLLTGQGRETAAGRGYRQTDLETLTHFGTASGYMAVMVLALYINSDQVKALYTHPELIWLLCPIFLYLISRIWLLARRGELQEDPVVFVIEDGRSQILAVLAALLLWIAT